MGPLSKLLGTEPLLQSGRVPSILNGGLGSVNLAYWVVVLGLAVFVESKSIDMQLNTGARSADYLPGMIGFDPLKKDPQQCEQRRSSMGGSLWLLSPFSLLKKPFFVRPL